MCRYYCWCINNALTTHRPLENNTHGKKARREKNKTLMQILSLFFRGNREKVATDRMKKMFGNYYYYSKKCHSICSRLNSLNLLNWLQFARVLCCLTFDKVEFKSLQRFVYLFFIYEIQSFQSQYLITIRQVNCFKIFAIALRTTSYGQLVTWKQSQCVYIKPPFQSKCGSPVHDI